MCGGRAEGLFRPPLYHLRSHLPVPVELGPTPDETEARRILLGKLAGAYGVTTPAHIAAITGLGVRECRAILNDLASGSGDLLPVEIESVPTHDRLSFVDIDRVKILLTS